MGVLQDARLVAKGEERVGIAGSLIMPLDPETRYDPNYGATVATGVKNPDMQYIPLPTMLGWYRRGLGVVEAQTSFSIPSFMVSVGMKLGIVGRDPGSPFALALTGEINWSPVDGATTFGAILHMSFMLSRRVSLDLSGRVGNYPGHWLGLTVSPTLGVTVGLKESKKLHIFAGGMIPTGIGPSTRALWLGAGVSY